MSTIGELEKEGNRKQRRMTASMTRKRVERENRKRPAYLIREEIPEHLKVDAKLGEGLIEVWRSRYFLVQVYDRGGDIVRMTVNRTDRTDGDWTAGIKWDDLQRCKREIGRGRLEGFEIYPADHEVVDVANMRHIWIFKNSRLPFGFGKPPSGEVLAKPDATGLNPKE